MCAQLCSSLGTIGDSSFTSLCVSMLSRLTEGRLDVTCMQVAVDAIASMACVGTPSMLWGMVRHRETEGGLL